MMIYAQISGYKVHQRTRKGQIIILSYDYAQNIRILKTRKGRMTIFSYDYSRISGYEFSEKNAPRMFRVQPTRQSPMMNLAMTIPDIQGTRNQKRPNQNT